MASAFSICALSSSWRVYIPPGGTVNNGTTIDDPQWCFTNASSEGNLSDMKYLGYLL